MKSILVFIFIISLIINVMSLIHIFMKSRQHKLKISKVMGFYLYVLSQFMMEVIFINVSYDVEKDLITALCILALIIIIMPIKALKRILDDIIEKEQVDEKYNAEDTVKWSKVTGANGYEVYMSTSKSGKYKKIKSLTAKKTSLTQKKLIKGKKYFFKVKAYKNVDGGKVYSSWSKVKSVKVK